MINVDNRDMQIKITLTILEEGREKNFVHADGRLVWDNYFR